MRTPQLKFNRSLIYLLLFITSAACLQSCGKKHHSDFSKILYEETGNKAFKKLDEDTFAVVLQKTLKAKSSSLNNPKLISAFYAHNNYEPTLVMRYFPKGQLKIIPAYLAQASTHGLNPELFQYTALNGSITKLYDPAGIKSEEEAYQELANLEIMTANSLVKYGNALEFGVISPRKIYSRYFTVTKRPDSASVERILAVKDLKSYLDSIQPKDPQYLALQKALAGKFKDPKMTLDETQRIITVNLERLRWKNKPTGDKYVLVNIADYRLDVIDHGKSVLNMKVVVGEGRNKDFTQNLKEYDENDLKKDRPFTRETPQLNSMIHSAQVNPVWNIPQSIATNEITKQAAQDPYYLSNHNIDVYKDGKIIENPETIDWSQGNPGKDYAFKQRPGEDNALGQIKFLFNNRSSVYLHDTPAKAAFGRSERALSHGCVRVEKPLDLAYQLFGDGAKYELIKKNIETPNPEATTLSLPKQVRVYLTYFTAWQDETGTLQLRKDVYGLDVVLYSYLKRLG